ncbi:aspartate kinase [Pseudotenacibaculum sp. MALMAid0570]|uniref:aspartate kinase n=1 Tax=Pseudotenacibaculum sp. MALMAid0570 TaxID=3143938 RepID=UPI0032DE896F
MKVYKFGGASIKDADSIQNVAKILKSEGTEGCLLVISAMGKMTNAFENIVHAYCYDKASFKKSLDFVVGFHEDIVNALFDEPNIVLDKVSGLFKNLNSFLAKNDSKSYDYLYDQIVSVGELLSTTIVSNYFVEEGIENIWNDVRKLIITDNSHRDAKVDWQKTQETIIESIDQKKLNIVQGFLGGDTKGNTTTLGREGSDYTAGIFAYCLDAKEVTIWKDVEGVLNADPRVFKETQLLEQISYEETIEMAFYGASVIHPKTIQPLQSKEIPLFVRSFKDLNLKGTKVTRGVAIKPYLPCFIVKKDQILVSISALDFSFMVENNISHIFKLLHQYLLKVNLIQNSAISFSVCVDNKFNQFETFLEELKSSYKVDVVKGVDLYTVRHFTDKSLGEIQQNGLPLLTQINKETAQIVIKQ